MNIKNVFLRKAICLVLTALIGFVIFYVQLPALNIQSPEFYSFATLIIAIYIGLNIVTSVGLVRDGFGFYFDEIKRSCKIPLAIIVLLIIFPLIASVFSAKIFRASDYRDLITINDGNFVEDVDEISFDKIPILDRDSAERLGDRKLGELSDMVSQFEVASDYSQINLNDRPVRVTPLEYGDVIKWFTNRGKGLPAYLIIDMANQEVEVVRLSEGMKYSNSEHFGRYLPRHLRMNYPTYMFSTPIFEVDENKTPYWICPRIVKKIGLFGGTDIQGAVLVNAITGESEYMETVPQWVDRVYAADLIVSQYNYYGAYQNGYINSLFGQKGVTATTEGYNYIALDDDVYMYTGITSVGSDQSNIGFILSNQRTKETKFYSVAGATELSAMASAEGVVQHLNYKATFPILLNISGEPTYFIALKDNAQLVKTYAMVNVHQYQLVATGATPTECERQYIALLSSSGLGEPEKITENEKSGTISDIRTAVIDGNSYYYIKLAEDDVYYSISASADESIVTKNIGDSISFTFEASEKAIKKIILIK